MQGARRSVDAVETRKSSKNEATLLPSIAHNHLAQACDYLSDNIGSNIRLSNRRRDGFLELLAEWRSHTLLGLLLVNRFIRLTRWLLRALYT